MGSITGGGVGSRPRRPAGAHSFRHHIPSVQQLTRPCRRTAFIYLILDTLASAESASPRLIAASELADFPLPAPDPIWSAPDAVSWAVATEAYPFSDRTLADGLATLFDPRGSVAAACRPQDNWRCGPFARLCLVLVILRETIDLGEGKARAEAGALPRWAWWATGDDMRPLLATALDLVRRLVLVF